MWKVLATQEFGKWYADLPTDAKEEVIGKLDLLGQFGPNLGRPHADTLNGSKHANMKELRAGTSDLVMRIAFAFDPERNAIILLGGDKAGMSQKQFYRQLITKADRLFDAHLCALELKKKEKKK